MEEEKKSKETNVSQKQNIPNTPPISNFRKRNSDVSFKNEFRKSLAQKSRINNVNNKADLMKNKLSDNKLSQKINDNKSKNVQNNFSNKKNSLINNSYDKLNSKQKNELDNKNDLNKNELGNKFENKNNNILKNNSHTKSSNLKKKVEDKINIKKRIKRKVILFGAPIVATILFNIIIVLIVIVIIFIPVIYIKDKFNFFNTSSDINETENEENTDSFYSTLSVKDMNDYIETTDFSGLDENDDDLDYNKAFNRIYNIGTGGYFTQESGDYTMWKQADTKWGSDRLGNSTTYTMATAGCAVTSVAIQIKRSGTQINLPAEYGEFNPGSFNAWGASNGGFVGADIVWNGCHRSGLTPHFQVGGIVYFSSNDTYTTKFNKIKEMIDKNYYVVLEVGRNQHWVAVTDYRNGRLYMIDPGHYSENTDIGKEYFELQYSNLYVYYIKED